MADGSQFFSEHSAREKHGVELRADQDGRALVAAGTEFLHGTQASQPAARDHDPLDAHEHLG